MTNDQRQVLEALYEFERPLLQAGSFENWASPQDVANSLPPTHPHYADVHWTRLHLQQLWVARKVMQVPVEPGDHTLQDVELDIEFDRHVPNDGKLRPEQNDCRGPLEQTETVAVFESRVAVKYRSRTAEIARLLFFNYQRYNMAPSTGLLRYEVRRQRRPTRTITIQSLQQQIQQEILAGSLSVQLPSGLLQFALRNTVDRQALSCATGAVLSALQNRLGGAAAQLAAFQANSIAATLCGIYSDAYRNQFACHIITAGVGSGKSYAFQIGALIHAAYARIQGQTGLRVLLLYPRVALAANQFQDLRKLTELTEASLHIGLRPAPLDAGSQLNAQMGTESDPRGATFNAICKAYRSGEYPIVITNLDTLVNRINHPEASRGLTSSLDLIVLDEVHLLQGLYGSHARMLLKRIGLLRNAWRARSNAPNVNFESLISSLAQTSQHRPYLIGASATIAEPCRHMARLAESESRQVLHVAVDTPEQHGWIHHLFLRQRSEVGSMTALVNATSCLIHNRRDGLFREYYRRLDGTPLSLDQLRNPLLPTPGTYDLQPTDALHKTLGFCDSLDGVGRWAAQTSDNENTNARDWTGTNAAQITLPYFCRFSEPLWRVPHHGSFAAPPAPWVTSLRSHYGSLCRDCKKGIPRTIPRIPSGLTTRARGHIQGLWDFSVANDKFVNQTNYLKVLGIKENVSQGAWLQPLHLAATANDISALDQCPFFLSGLCWWWSMDNPGNNAPAPIGATNTLNGLKRLTSTSSYSYPCSVRPAYFTSKSERQTLGLNSIDDLYRWPLNVLFNDRSLPVTLHENASLLIGSPRLEVGIDLSRATDGLTFRTMRDPASFQQKVGRAGRELGSDSLWVHVVTESVREQYYLRNAHIALDPEFLQPIPLHEDNRIVACQHFLMAIFDFLCLQAENPHANRIPNQGHRLLLINDHANHPAFARWDLKVQAVSEYLFSGTPPANLHLAGLTTYLSLLGAAQNEIAAPGANLLSPQQAPLSQGAGVLDVFRHELSPSFLLTPLASTGPASTTLARICASTNESTAIPGSQLPRHADFLRTFEQVDEEGGRNPHLKRSYFRDLLKLPIFRRGLPSQSIPGNNPFAWPQNLFEGVGGESVRIVHFNPNGQSRELSYESMGVATNLLLPGAVTYRYGSNPLKVAAGSHQCAGQPTQVAPGVYSVVLRLGTGEHFDLPNIAPVQQTDLPRDFVGVGPLRVYRPRQLVLLTSRQEPWATPTGLLIDDDSATLNPAAPHLALKNPPQCYAVRWYRVEPDAPVPAEPRWVDQVRDMIIGSAPFTSPPHPVFELFRAINYDPQVRVTAFSWALDRQFQNSSVDPARLVYRGSSDGGYHPVGIGDEMQTRALIFELGLHPHDVLPAFLDELDQQTHSAAYQTLLLQTLTVFLQDYARTPDPSGAPIQRPSHFAVKDLRTILLFHLLRIWHPDNGQTPAGPPQLTLNQLAACFDPNSPTFLTQQAFNDICQHIAQVRQTQDAATHSATLQGHRQNFLEASAQHPALNNALFRTVAEDLLVNSLALSMHSAAIRLAGAQEENLGYFYKRFEDHYRIYLFDTDPFGNGTVDLVRDNIHIPAFVRALTDRVRQCGNPTDPLPSRDFAHCLEEELQECAESQAAHLAFLKYTPGADPAFAHLDPLVQGEHNQAAFIFDFMRQQLGLTLFDHSCLLRACPEFLAHVAATYTLYGGQPIVGSPAYPNFQAFESAMGYCASGCVSCLVAPEHNIHGTVTSADTVNKPLLDAFYRRSVCERVHLDTPVTYPGTGPGATTPWTTHASDIARALGRNIHAPSIDVQYPVRAGAAVDMQTLRIPFSVRPANCFSVLRSQWQASATLNASVRIIMEF